MLHSILSLINLELYRVIMREIEMIDELLNKYIFCMIFTITFKVMIIIIDYTNQNSF